MTQQPIHDGSTPHGETNVRPAAHARLSLRSRVTIAVLLIALVVQSAIGLAVLLYQHHAINEFFRHRVELRLERIARQLANSDANAEAGAFSEMVRDPLSVASIDGSVLWVRRPDGSLLAHPDIPMPASLVEICARAEGSERVQHAALDVSAIPPTEPSHSWRTAALCFRMRDGASRCVVLAIPEKYAPAMTQAITQAIVASLVLGVLTSGIAVWFVAKRLLAPVSSVAEWARKLRPELLDARDDGATDASPVELARVREELQQSRDRLRDAFAAQERFLSNAAHELKTPIAVLLAEAQTVRTAGIPEETQHFVRSVSDEMTRLGRMLESFLLLTKIRTGKAEPHPARHLVNELAANAGEQARVLAARQGVRLVARLDEAGLDAEVCGDDGLLQTMLDNLIRNAIRFSPQGREVTIEVSVGAEFAEIAVRDEGPGIALDVAERLFDRFPRAEFASQRGRGAGLGLAVAQGIAELHGGTIRFSNRPSGGCEFVVRLALAGATPTSQRSRSPVA